MINSMRKNNINTKIRQDTRQKEGVNKRAARVEEIFSRLSSLNPQPKSELYYTNPFTLLVAVVLSAQATDAGVNKATPALFALADTP